MSRKPRDIPKKWIVQARNLNYLYNTWHHLEYLHVFGDSEAMRRRCYGHGDIHRWIGDVQGPSATTIIICLFSGVTRLLLRVYRRASGSIAEHLTCKSTDYSPNITEYCLVFPLHSRNNRRALLNIRFGIFMCEWKLISCQYREQPR